MKRFLHIVLVLLVAVACRGPRVIPKDTMTDIYTDMFLADQMVRDADIPRAQMDTMLLYEAVFEKYGYDTEDYLYSLRFYLKDPERFGKVFENVAKRLEGEVEALKKIVELRNRIASKRDADYPLVDSLLAPFSKESVFVGLARVERDTSRYPAWFRLAAVHEDTLMVSVDSLAALRGRDSLSKEKPSPEADLAEPVRKPELKKDRKEKLRPRRFIGREETIATEEVEEVEEVSE
jgi:hypothetical protein